MNCITKYLVGLLVLSGGVCFAQNTPQMNLPRLRLGAGMHIIDAQLATTPEQHGKGLMFRKKMPTNEGMLFVFDKETPVCFWMKNTMLPLSIAFIRTDGVIVNLDEMQEQTETPHCAKEPVRYVLEMNKGWFKKKGITPGFKLSGYPFDN